jgi:SAM-dependent methyltransferase
MNDQDFEAYARHKAFNFNIASTWQAAVDEAVAALGPSSGLSVLDYGCGDGKYFGEFIRRGIKAENVHGVDVSALRVERCANIGWTNARQIDGKGPLPYPAASFDLINCMEVIEHIPREHSHATVAELRRVLRPGGILLISTPNYPIKRFYDWFDALVHRKWRRIWDDPTHVTHFNHARLSQLLQSEFGSVQPRMFKPGFLYSRFPRPFFLHKLFFLCRA